MDEPRLHQLMSEQDGVLSRRQVLACGGDDNLIERRLRRREWARVRGGVYVDHTGPLTWTQRAWVAVLACWPAALCHVSALEVEGFVTGVKRDDCQIHVAVDPERHLDAHVGIRVHRVSRLATWVRGHRTPPRVSFELAVLQVAADADDDAGAVAVVADACQARRTTPVRLLTVLRQRPRHRRKRFLMAILDDVASGAYSVLEHRYLTRVERPHGLPTARRQRRVSQGRGAAYRDVEYTGLGVVVELDGRLGHELQADRWDDMDRDIDSVVTGDATLRAGWRQVLDPCRLAAGVARLLKARGWAGRPTPCGPSCAVHAVLSGGFPAPEADDPPQSRGRP